MGVECAASVGLGRRCGECVVCRRWGFTVIPLCSVEVDEVVVGALVLAVGDLDEVVDVLEKIVEKITQTNNYIIIQKVADNLHYQTCEF